MFKKKEVEKVESKVVEPITKNSDQRETEARLAGTYSKATR